MQSLPPVKPITFHNVIILYKSFEGKIKITNTIIYL